MVAYEAELRASLTNPDQSATIIDRGLTEFGGVPTLTTAAQGVSEPSTRKAAESIIGNLRRWLIQHRQSK